MIIDGFQQIKDPIYGGLTFTVNNDGPPKWIEQNVGMWLGLKAYVEVLDDGDGVVTLDQIVFSDDATPPERPNRLWTQVLENPSVVDAPSLAAPLSETAPGIGRRMAGRQARQRS